MTDTSLRGLLEAAEGDLDTYRHPDVSEAQRRLNEVLEAAGLGSTGTDRITRLRVGPREVFVRTEYSVRSCICDDEYEFPVGIIDEPDPVAAARRWGLERRRKEAVGKLEEARRALAHWESELAGIEEKLAA